MFADPGTVGPARPQTRAQGQSKCPAERGGTAGTLEKPIERTKAGENDYGEEDEESEEEDGEGQGE